MTKHKYSVSSSEDFNDTIDPNSVPWWTSSRLALAVLGFFGFVNVYALRVNMSVAIVCMVNQTALKAQEGNTTSNKTLPYSSSCGLIPTDPNSTVTDEFKGGEFVWDKGIQGYILGSFFWGYLLTQIPGGWLATKIGGKRVYGYSMLAATLATLFTPIAAQTSWVLLLVFRILVGVASGVCYPSMHTMWAAWAPPLERSKLASFTYAGAQVGNVITLPLAGLLCKYGFAGGWPSIFYINGMTSVVWFILWMWLVSDTPAQHPRISKIEKAYIAHSLRGAVKSESDKSVSIPWRKIVTSMPVWAILVANITTDWGAYTLLTSIPTYMSEVLKLDISTNGLYSALPYIAFWAVINIAGWLADFIMAKGCCSTTIARKSFTTFGMLFPAAMLIILGYLDCSQPILAITLLVLGVSMSGAQYSGWLINHMDVAPVFAGVLFGISNSISAITGFLSPVIVGKITTNQSREDWQVVFYISAGIYVAGAVFYGIFASGKVMPWAKQPENVAISDIELLERNGTMNGDAGKEMNGDTVHNDQIEKDESKQALC